jgi:hypothetical protein
LAAKLVRPRFQSEIEESEFDRDRYCGKGETEKVEKANELIHAFLLCEELQEYSLSADDKKAVPAAKTP